MKRKPLLYNTQEDEVIVKLSSRSTKKGDVLFSVEYSDESSEYRQYACFTHLSSALDFIQTNFR